MKNCMLNQSEGVNTVKFKKVWSYHPTLWKTLDLQEMLVGYSNYLEAYFKSPFFKVEEQPKSLDEWLETEI